VEDINLRITTLRDLDGTVHHIPNGEIKKASNLSKSFARVNLNIGISYNSNLEKVTRVINKVGKELPVRNLSVVYIQMERIPV
jgi:small conductance mechanosensitive channel